MMFPLISAWTIRVGQEKAAVPALKRLGAQVEAQEKDNVAYLVHIPDRSQPSLPTPSRLEVVFFEIYRDKAGFEKHVTGPIFKNFVKRQATLLMHAGRGQGWRKDKLAAFDCGVFDPAGGIYPARSY
jgi:quinol monooxygenase YgiN